MKNYIHKVKYYETDKMGVTHHSNYIRWMEEARIDYLDQIGWNFAKLESAGIVSPVTAVDCKYKISTEFDDEIEIKVTVYDFNGVRLKLKYEMLNAEQKIVCEGYTEHCFLNAEGKFVRLKRDYPEFYQTLYNLINDKC